MVIPTSVLLYLGFLCLLVCERGAELLLTRRNARVALAAGGVETGRRAYAVMVVVHALFPVACAGEVLALRRPFPGAPGFVALTVALGAQALRWSAISTVGWRWSTRINVVPGGTPVTVGPYRFL